MNKKGFTLMELLGVIVILGIIITLAVSGYTKYLSKGRNVTYKTAESSLKSAAVNAMMDCMTNKNTTISFEDKRNFCNSHSFPEEKYENTYVYLNDLVNLDYIEPIHDPKNTEELCSYSSYVYLSNKSDTSINNNMDLEYSICLMCGDYRSESCIPEVDEANKFLASCNIYSDSDGINAYINGWDDNLYLFMNVDEGAGYYEGIDYFNVTVGGNSRIVDAKDNRAVISLLDFLSADKKFIDNEEVKIVAVDRANRGSKEIVCGNVNIDTSSVKNGRIIAKKENGNTNIDSGEWSNDKLLLTAITNPSKVKSGFEYKWYKDDEVLKDWSSENAYLISETGKYYFEVRSLAEGKIVKSEVFDAKIDLIAPTCKVLVDESATSKYGNYYIKAINLKMAELSDTGGSGVESNSLDVSKITTSVDNKVVTGTIKDKAGNVNTCELTVNVDVTVPTIIAKENPISLGNQDYVFTSNLNIAYGSTEGTVICNPENSQKTGTYDVTCTATGNNGLSKSVTFGARHSYAATPTCTNGGTYDATKKACHYNASSECSCNTYKSCSNSACGTESYCSDYRNDGCCGSYEPCDPWACDGCASGQTCSLNCGHQYFGSSCCTGSLNCGSCHKTSTRNKTCRTAGCGCEKYNSCDLTDGNHLKYTCPNGGTASGSTCYY